MFNRLKLRGYLILALSQLVSSDATLNDLLANLIDFLEKNDSKKTGDYTAAKSFFEAVTARAMQLLANGAAVTWTAKKASTARISESMFTDLNSAALNTRPVSETVTKETDENGEELDVLTTQATDELCTVTDKAFVFGGPNAEQSDWHTRLYLDMQADLSKAIMELVQKSGVDFNGRHYVHCTTTAKGGKDGEHYFATKAVIDSMMREKMLKFAQNADLAPAKFLTHSSLLFTDAKRCDTVADFLKHVVVIDIDSDQYKRFFTSKVKARFVKFEEKLTRSMKRKIVDGEFDHNPTDGAILINSAFAAVYAGCMMQIRAFEVKGLAQVVSFADLCDFLGVDRDTKVHDMLSGADVAISDVSMILTKDTFKGLSKALKGGYTSYASYSAEFGYNDLYAKAVFEDRVREDETFSYTKQFLALQVLDKATAHHIAERNLAEMKELAFGVEGRDLHDIRVDFAARCFEGQAVKGMLTDVDSSYLYTDTCAKKVDEAYFSKWRESMNKWQVKGHTVVAFPDVVRFFASVLKIEHEGLCGNDNAVFCPSLGKGKILITRNPVLANDGTVQRNLYSKSNPAAKFCHSATCYFGWCSAAPKSMNCDFDGDKVNVTEDSMLIAMVDRTNELLEMPMIEYRDLKNKKDITDPELAGKFTGSDVQIAATLARAKIYSAYVGKSAGIISQIACEINKAVNKGDYARANAIFLQDLVPMAQQEQLAVDASKTLAFYLWDKSGSVLGSDWYKKAGGMVMKEYEEIVLHKIESSDYLDHYKCEDLSAKFLYHPVDENGWENCWEDGTNVAMMHDIFASEVPAHLFFTRNNVMSAVATPELKKLQEERPFDISVIRVSVKDRASFKVQITKEAWQIVGRYKSATAKFGNYSEPVVPADWKTKSPLDASKRMDASLVAGLIRRIWATKDIDRRTRVADLTALYRALSEVNPELYPVLSGYVEKKGKNGCDTKETIRLACIMEISSREKDGMVISDPVLYAAGC